MSVLEHLPVPLLVDLYNERCVPVYTIVMM